MILSGFISKLLLDYDCVIIPEFGGFVANYAGAKIHPTQHTFEAPFKQIAFNKNLTNNDGLLANTVALELALSFSDANKWIEQEVLRIEIRLAKKEKVELTDIGTLYYDIERNLQFNPASTSNFLLDSFGLSSFQSPSIKRENYTERIEKQFKDRPAIINPDKKKASKKLWPIALTLSVLIVFLVIPSKTNLWSTFKVNYSNLIPTFGTNEKSNYKERSEAFLFDIPAEKSMQPVAEMDAMASIALTNDNSKTIPIKLQTAQADTSLAESPIISGIAHSPVHSYDLIAGCFMEKENADEFVKELRAKGFDANIAGQSPSGLYRVSYHTFQDKTSAEAAKAELRTENPGIWVYQN